LELNSKNLPADSSFKNPLGYFGSKNLRGCFGSKNLLPPLAVFLCMVEMAGKGKTSNVSHET
jgi:hypothetical protein